MQTPGPILDLLGEVGAGVEEGEVIVIHDKIWDTLFYCIAIPYITKKNSYLSSKSIILLQWGKTFFFSKIAFSIFRNAWARIYLQVLVKNSAASSQVLDCYTVLSGIRMRNTSG